MRYQLKQRMISLAARYDITGSDGEPAWEARVAAFRLATSIRIRRAGERNGPSAMQMRRRFFSFRGIWDVRFADGSSAVIRRPFRLLGGTITVEASDGRRWTAEGDFSHYEYAVESRGKVVGLVSKRFFSIRDIYGIQMKRRGHEPSPDDLPILAIALVIDQAHHEHSG